MKKIIPKKDVPKVNSVSEVKSYGHKPCMIMIVTLCAIILVLLVLVIGKGVSVGKAGYQRVAPLIDADKFTGGTYVLSNVNLGVASSQTVNAGQKNVQLPVSVKMPGANKSLMFSLNFEVFPNNIVANVVANDPRFVRLLPASGSNPVSGEGVNVYSYTFVVLPSSDCGNSGDCLNLALQGNSVPVNITFNVTASAGSSFMINLTSFIYYDNNSVPTSLSVGKKSVVYNVIGECNLNIDCDAKSYCEADHRCVSIAGSGQQIQGSGYGEDAYYTATVGKEACSDFKDNDGDNLVDCADSDCASNRYCVVTLSGGTYCVSDNDCNELAAGGASYTCVNNNCTIGTDQTGYGEDGYYNDADGDGVTGTADLCPSIGTPATVSSNGCLYGDTNIDGCVNFDDVSVIAQNVDFDCPSENHAAGQSGRAGDVTNDGCVNFDDISKIALNVNFDCISN